MFLLLSISSAARADAPPGTARGCCCASVGAAAKVFNELSPEEHAIASARSGVVSGACAHDPRRVLQRGDPNATLMPPRRPGPGEEMRFLLLLALLTPSRVVNGGDVPPGIAAQLASLARSGCRYFRSALEHRVDGKDDHCARRRPLRQDYYLPANRDRLTSTARRSLESLSAGGWSTPTIRLRWCCRRPRRSRFWPFGACARRDAVRATVRQHAVSLAAQRCPQSQAHRAAVEDWKTERRSMSDLGL